MSEWQRVADKPLPTAAHTVLVATDCGGSWSYDVITHWPDGTWSDQATQDPIEDWLPVLWAEIHEPRTTPRSKEGDQ